MIELTNGGPPHPRPIVYLQNNYWHFQNFDCKLNTEMISVNLNSSTNNIQNPTHHYMLLRPQCAALSLWSGVQVQIGSAWKVSLTMKFKNLSNYNRFKPTKCSCIPDCNTSVIYHWWILSVCSFQCVIHFTSRHSSMRRQFLMHTLDISTFPTTDQHL
jgi:hypothetical protein